MTNVKIEKEFLILNNGTRIHIPTLELLSELNVPLFNIIQKGNQNVATICFGSNNNLTQPEK